MLLADGRRVGCLEVGAVDGFPIFHCHGNGSSRLEVALLADAAASTGVRLIGLDRPGIGKSDPAPGQSLLDWPQDVAQVADRLQIERFAITGFSAGGAYALACAHGIPRRLTGCALVSSVCPPELIQQAAPPWMRVACSVAQHHPRFAEACMQFLLPDGLSDLAGAEERLRRFEAWLARPDQELLRQPPIRQALVRSMVESRCQGTGTNRREVLELVRPWNLTIEDISLPGIFLWHGGADRLTPIAPARLLAKRLSRCSAAFPAGEGHFSTLANHGRDAFAALRA